MELHKLVDTRCFFPKPIKNDQTKVTSVSPPQLKIVTPDVSDTPVAVTLPAVKEASSASGQLSKESFPNFPSIGRIFLAQNGVAFAEVANTRNRFVLAVGSRQLNLLIASDRRKQGLKARANDINEVNVALQAYAEMSGVTRDVWYRVAPISKGIEIDLGDDGHSRVHVTAGKVEIVTTGSNTPFYRTSVSMPMAMPAKVGNRELLRKYVNLHPASRLVFIAWLTYTLAHPKLSTSKYVILVLNGHQGSGKSFLCQMIQSLIDPNRVGLQLLPSNGLDLGIAAQNAHVLCYDNIRNVNEVMADAFCVAATGGALSSRQLYTNSEQQVTRLHAALVLNGIHTFVNQPDFAQRTLPLELLPISESNRKSEVQLSEEFKADLPEILRGLLDLIAEIFKHFPNAEVTNPERMYAFSKWLAAMEIVDKVGSGVYQGLYSSILNEGQRDTLQENLLAAAILEFAEDQIDGDSWSGKPSDLLTELNKRQMYGTQRSREWPDNSIALSKRLVPLRAALATQNIVVEFTRGKHRMISITKKGKSHD